MDKIVITGHTSGIGKVLHNHFGGVGLSKSTGFDISKDDINPYLEGCGLFINNAYTHDAPYAQIDLAVECKNIKQIVVGSLLSDSVNDTRLKGRFLQYTTAKSALEATCHQLFVGGYNITLIKPGHVDTPMISQMKYKKIDPKYIIKVVQYILDSDPVRIKEVSFSC